MCLGGILPGVADSFRRAHGYISGQALVSSSKRRCDCKALDREVEEKKPKGGWHQTRWSEPNNWVCLENNFNEAPP